MQGTPGWPIRPARRLAAVPAPVLVLAGIVSVQFGGALAAGLVRQLGSLIAVALRLDIAALVLIAFARPSLRGRSREAWTAAALLGASLGVMNLCFYSAIARLPLGVVVTIEFLGPLGLAAAISRRPRDFIAVIAALAGVVMVSGVLQADLAGLDLLGLGLAAAAGACWAGYILATRAVGRLWRQLDGLAVAMVVGAAMVTPFAVVAALDTPVSTAQLMVGATVAILSSVLPYSLELVALRRIDTRVFGILLSLDPAVAALAGLLILGEAMGALEVGGMALVILASALVLVTQPRGEPSEAALTEIAEIG
jgi:inner membrane transporter RhtA